MHAGKVTGSSVHAGLLKQGGSGGCTGGWCRLSCAHGNSCVDMHKMLGGRVGWVGGDEQLSEGCTERWEELGEFKIFNCNWLYFLLSLAALKSDKGRRLSRSVHI